jgi:hypothetical protein
MRSVGFVIMNRNLLMEQFLIQELIMVRILPLEATALVQTQEATTLVQTPEATTLVQTQEATTLVQTQEATTLV